MRDVAGNIDAGMTPADYKGKTVSKVITVLLLLAMALHLFKPLGLPGLKKRRDFWKIAIIAFAVWTVALLLREAG